MDFPRSSGEGLFTGPHWVCEAVQFPEFSCLEQIVHGFAVVGHGVDIGTGVAVQAGGLRISKCARRGLRLPYVSRGQPASRYQPQESHWDGTRATKSGKWT